MTVAALDPVATCSATADGGACNAAGWPRALAGQKKNAAMARTTASQAAGSHEAPDTGSLQSKYSEANDWAFIRHHALNESFAGAGGSSNACRHD
jgi:hypothetical protein